MPKIFINYRREDAAGYAGRVFDRLEGEFGQHNVFIDVDALQPGDDFINAINGRLGQCDVMLAIIGPRWVSITDSGGRARLEDESDFVRIELQTAIERGIRIIPILVDRASMPRLPDVPESLRPLLRRQSTELSDTRWNYDLARLVDKIKEITDPAKSIGETTNVSGGATMEAPPASIRAEKPDQALIGPERVSDFEGWSAEHHTWFVVDVLRAALLNGRVYEVASRSATMTLRSITVVILAGLIYGCVVATPLLLETLSHRGFGEAFRPLSRVMVFIATSYVGTAVAMAAVVWVCWSYAAYFIGSKVVGGRGRPDEVLRALAFAQPPLAMSGFGLVFVAPGVTAFSPPVALLGYAWTIAAGTVALRKSCSITMLKALGATVLALGATVAGLRVVLELVSDLASVHAPLGLPLGEMVIDGVSRSMARVAGFGLGVSILGAAYGFRRLFAWQTFVIGVAAAAATSVVLLGTMTAKSFIPAWIVFAPASLIRTIPLPSNTNSGSAALAPDGHHLAVGALGDDRAVSLVDLSTGEVSRRFLGHACCPNGAVTSVAFTPDGKRMASAADENAIRLWDAETGQMLRAVPALNIESLAFSPDGSLLAAGSLDGPVTVWAAGSGQLLHTLEALRGRVNDVTFSPDGRYLASATGTPLAVEAGPGSHDDGVRLWNAREGTLVRTLLGHSSEVRSIAFAPNGRLLASASWDQSVRVWEVSTGQQVRLLNMYQSAEAVAFSPDGTKLAVGLRDGSVEAFEVQSWTNRIRFSAHSGDIRFLAFTPDGQRILTIGSLTLRIWDVEMLMATLGMPSRR